MRLDSHLSPQDYLYHMRQNVRIRLSDMGEGFSGVVIGNLFLIRYHAVNGSERQRIHKVESRRPRCTYNAFGFVNGGDYGTEVSFLYTTGFLDPVSFALYILIGILVFLKDGFLFNKPVVVLFIAVFISVLVIVITMVTSRNASCAERGRKRILKFLADPSIETSI